MTYRFTFAASLLAAACMGLSPPAGAEPRFSLTGAWPSGAAIDRVEGQEVRFASESPFSPENFADLAAAPKVMARALLFMPAGRKRPGSVPAVLLLHGSSGVQDARELTYGRQLAAMGIAALVIDTYGARRRPEWGFIDRVINITESMMIADAYAGLRWLASTHPAIDPKRVALIGFSYGAMATMYAMNAKLAAQLGNGLTFAGHAAFYGPCIARFADTRTTGAPLLMLYGAADTLIDPERCGQYAEDMRKGGSVVEIVAYPGAVHQWDGGWGRRTIGRTMQACRLWVERDGTVRDLNTLLAMSSPFRRKVILGLCANGPPYPIGADETTRVKSNRDLGRFLARVFRKY
ncbi:MAG: dienelactone hydrolase family protein [Rhodospirillaceae bacterium]|nr:dienelactone hydrolase family protein [Rhodospirillaceae bacterium]